MNDAARAIIIVNDHLLLMERVVEGNSYYTLVGGGIKENETPEEAVVREIDEETSLKVTGLQHVFSDITPTGYPNQYIFLCEVEADGPMGIKVGSEEDTRNKMGLDVHELAWMHKDNFGKLPFRTPQLQAAIVTGLKKGFPKEPTSL